MKSHATASEGPSGSANITCYFYVSSNILSCLITLTETFTCSPIHSFSKSVSSAYAGSGIILDPKEYNGRKEKETRAWFSWSLQSRMEERCYSNNDTNWCVISNWSGKVYNTLKDYGYSSENKGENRVRSGWRESRGHTMLELAREIKNCGFLSYKQWGSTEVFQSGGWHDQI